MQLKERDRERAGDGGGVSGDDTDDTLASAREAGERLLVAGDAAITRALSGDSEAFLKASRQEGGQ